MLRAEREVTTMTWTDSEQQRRNEVLEEQLEAFFDAENIDYPFQPWKTDRWEQRRSELIGKKCKWCSGTDDLQVHHEEHSPSWRSVWNTERNELFFEDYYQPAKYAPHTAVCPGCLKKSYAGRVTKSPTYRCSNCPRKFNEPLLYPRQDSDVSDLWSDLTDFAEDYADQITERFKPAFWSEWDAYFEGKDTITLCRGCHDSVENR